jgi:outer membrane protein assembly factor BamB
LEIPGQLVIAAGKNDGKLVSNMNVTDLVYIGIKGSVIALHRATGQQIWATQLKGSGFVNVVALPDRIYATTYGEVFCLEPLTGRGIWHNTLTGFGLGLSTIALAGLPSAGLSPAVQEEYEREQRNSVTTTTSTTTVL